MRIYENLAEYLLEEEEGTKWEDATEYEKAIYTAKAKRIYNALSTF